MKVVVPSATDLRALALSEACVLLPTSGHVTRTWSSVKGGLWK